MYRTYPEEQKKKTKKTYYPPGEIAYKYWDWDEVKNFKVLEYDYKIKTDHYNPHSNHIPTYSSYSYGYDTNTNTWVWYDEVKDYTITKYSYDKPSLDYYQQWEKDHSEKMKVNGLKNVNG